MRLTPRDLYAFADKLERADAMMLRSAAETDPVAPEIKDIIVQALRDLARRLASA